MNTIPRNSSSIIPFDRCSKLKNIKYLALCKDVYRMYFLPFSVDERNEAVKEIDVIMRVKINSIKMMKLQGYRIPHSELVLIDPKLAISDRQSTFAEIYDAQINEMLGTGSEPVSLNRLSESTEISKVFQTVLQQSYTKTITDPTDLESTIDSTALVYFPISTKTGKQTSKALLKDFLNEMTDKNYNVGIIITEKPLNVKTRDDIDKVTRDTLVLRGDSKSLASTVRLGTLFYTFTYDQLLYNVTEHYLVPKHEILDEDSTQTLVSSGIDIQDLSIISFSDPVVNRIGAIPGDVIKITGISLVQTGSRDYINYKIVRDIPEL